MRLIQTVQTSYEPDTYVLDGCLCNGGSSLALSISNHSLRLYDTQTTAFLFDLKQHTKRVSDVVCTPADPSILYSSQEDAGVMVTDVRQGSAVHFLTDMCNSGATCNTISITPSGNTLAVAADGDVHVVDRRMWSSTGMVEGMHLDEITRLRFLDEHVFCSAGEDQMINFITTAPGVVDDDILLQAISCGEVMTKMSCLPEVSAVAMIGTLENGFVCPFDLEQTEAKYERPGFDTYLVDWCVVSGQLLLVSGVRDDDGNPGPLKVMDWATRTTETLPHAHKELGRVAIGFGDRLITGGEDGLLAFWSNNPADVGLAAQQHQQQHTAASISSSSRGAQKQRPVTATGEATGADAPGGASHRGKPYGQRGNGRGRGGGGRGGRGGGSGGPHRPSPHHKPY